MINDQFIFARLQGHGRAMVEDGTPLQTQATVCGQQGSTGHRRSHLTVTQDEVRQDREHRFARGALDTPNGDPTQPDTDVMRVACPASASAAGRLGLQLKAKGEEEGAHELEKRLAIVKQLKGCRFMRKIDGDGPVFPSRSGWLAPMLLPGHRVFAVYDPTWRSPLTISSA